MHPERIARPERRSHRWFRLGSTPDVQPDPLDDRSMRWLELGVAGFALAVVVLLSIVHPSDAGWLRTAELVLVGGVLFVSALVSFIR